MNWPWTDYLNQRRVAKQRRDAESDELLRQIAKKIEDRERLTLKDLAKKLDPPKFDATLEELEQTYSVAVWVYAAINVIAEKTASVEWQCVDSENEDIGLENMPIRPNPLHSWNTLRQLTQIHLDTTGIAYWLYDEEDRQFFPLRPSRIRVVPAKGGRDIAGYAFKKDAVFQIDSGNGKRSPRWYFGTPKAHEPMSQSEFDAYLKQGTGIEAMHTSKKDDWIPIPKSNVIRFAYPNPNSDFYGQSPLQPFTHSLQSELFAREWNKRFFENGGIPSFLMVVQDEMDEDDFKALERRFKQEHKGVKNAWKTLILEGYEKLEIHELGMKHTDMDFLNLLHMTREEALAVLNVPPVMVGVYNFPSGGGARSAGASEQRESFWKDTVIPKLKIQEDAINESGVIDFGEGNRLTFDIQNIDALQPNKRELAQTARDALLGGLTLGEVRVDIWQKPAEPDGDVYLPSTVTPIAGGNISDDAPATEVAYHLTRQKAVSRDGIWQQTIKAVEPIENRLFRFIRRLFASQQRRVIDATTEQFDKSLSDILLIFNEMLQTETAIYREAAQQEFELDIEDAADIALQRARIEESFDVLNPAVQRFLAEKSFNFATRVNDTTFSRLRSQFRQAIDNGESIDEITERIQSVFAGTVRGSASRARMIARTETTGIANGGARLAYQQYPDVVEQVEWLSSRDNRVRPSHTAADGQVRAIGEAFTVGGSRLRFPGDPAAPVQEIINCRCAILPVI